MQPVMFEQVWEPGIESTLIRAEMSKLSLCQDSLLDLAVDIWIMLYEIKMC